MFLFCHTAFTEGIQVPITTTYLKLVLKTVCISLQILRELPWFDFNGTEKDDNAYEKKSNNDWTVSTSYNAINTYNIMGFHEILAILLFFATSGTMKDVEHHEKRMKIQYWGKGIYFSMEMPLPSSSSQIMTINKKYRNLNSCVLYICSVSKWCRNEA